MKQALSLHIGLNGLSPEYENEYAPLVASENDAEEMCHIAKGSGFDTHILCGPDANCGNLKDELDSARQYLQEGSLFLLTFSGHGTYTKSPTKREPYDANWCLYDTPIVDDELGKLLTKFNPGVDIVVISDSCNTGSIVAHFVESGYGAVKFVQGDIAMSVHDDYVARNGPIALADDPLDIAANILLISASQDYNDRDGPSPAYDGIYDGVDYIERNSMFTTALMKVWDGGKFSGDYKSLYDGICVQTSTSGRWPATLKPRIAYYPQDGQEMAYWASRRPFRKD